jgi:DNA-binding transcriptional LysR family regulator
MNWDHIAFDWNQARAFLATVEEGSLSGAARALGLTQPTLGRQVTALEQTLGVVLFERVGRSLELTPAGRELVEHAQAMRDAANRVSLAASGQSQAIAGKVTITASDIFSTYLLPEVVRRVQVAAPRLEIDIVAANDIRDLQRREADIAVRHVRPAQPDLVARLLYEADAYFYAATSYLQRRGDVGCVEDLAQHDFVGFEDTDRMIAYLADIGIVLKPENFRIVSANGLVVWELVQQGFGITPMAELVGHRTKNVERLLPNMPPIVFPVWLTTHRELHSSRRIRLVFDILADTLKEQNSRLSTPQVRS